VQEVASGDSGAAIDSRLVLNLFGKISKRGDCSKICRHNGEEIGRNLGALPQNYG
jgi:hypothetical protein